MPQTIPTIRASIAASLLALTLALPAVAQNPSTRPDPGIARLEAQFAELAKISGGGSVGVAAIHLESGRSAFLNRAQGFHMASTFKVPIAVRLLTQVDRGQLRLDSMITLRPTDLHPGSGTLSDLFRQPGVSLSVRNLMELMLRISDNSATDIMLRTAGGAGPVNARLAELGVQGIRLDRSTVRLISDFSGIRTLPSEDVTLEEFGNLRRTVTDDDRRAALATFDTDPRDTSTPEGMARLLEKIWRRQALSPANSDLLLDIMYRCETGAERIKGMLPPRTQVAHKTGSLAPGRGFRGGVVANDVGIIDLPNGAGHLITAIFVKNAEDATVADKTIAHIARAAYDYFSLTTQPSEQSSR
jgi:beta-lactamase class A